MTYTLDFTPTRFDTAYAKFGSVISPEGVRYELKGQAELTNRVFPGWFGDADEGEEFTAEYSATAVGPGDVEYEVIWAFDVAKGDEPDDESNYDWSLVDRIEER